MAIILSKKKRHHSLIYNNTKLVEHYNNKCSTIVCILQSDKGLPQSASQQQQHKCPAQHSLGTMSVKKLHYPDSRGTGDDPKGKHNQEEEAGQCQQ